MLGTALHTSHRQHSADGQPRPNFCHSVERAAITIVPSVSEKLRLYTREGDVHPSCCVCTASAHLFRGETENFLQPS